MSSSDERYTPPQVMVPLIKLFGEMWDPCPKSDQKYYKWDGLLVNWGNKNFVNPPYSNICAWAQKAVREAETGQFVAFLIPNDCSTSAFKLLRHHAWGRWEIPFRVKFDTPEGKKVDVARSHVVFFLGGLK